MWKMSFPGTSNVISKFDYKYRIKSSNLEHNQTVVTRVACELSGGYLEQNITP